jgi:hypothetical protein
MNTLELLIFNQHSTLILISSLHHLKMNDKLILIRTYLIV